MARRKRSKYKSGLEERLHAGPLKKLEYEPKSAKVKYTFEKTYNPDFVSPKEPRIFYEAKGRMRTSDEAKKYVKVKECNPDVTIRFIITTPDVRAYPQTSQTLGDWLTKHGFEWCTESTIPDSWRQ